jgi:prepilin-type N-terminal cleavage/methylation domain-containing protein
MIKINKQKGFTLIELLVVIAIIGILASIVLVSLGGAREKARNAKRESDIRQISLAMEMAYDDSQAYPTIEAPEEGGRIDSVNTTSDYLNPWPTDPGGGSGSCNDIAGLEYCGYDNSGDTSLYCVYAELEGEGGGYFIASQRGTAHLTATPTSACQ